MTSILQRKHQTTVLIHNKGLNIMGRSVYRRTRYRRLRIASILSLVLILGTIIFFVISGGLRQKVDVEQASVTLDELGNGRIVDSLIKPNKYSRPQTPLEKVNGVVIHYTANPGTDAQANRNYFNNLPKINKETNQKTYASSNFIIGIDGKVLCVVPETEVAYASNDRNNDTLSIECCYMSENGAFTNETHDSLVWLVSSICKAYKLSEDDVIRHYDITGKICPKYYVEHKDEWKKLKQEIGVAIHS